MSEQDPDLVKKLKPGKVLYDLFSKGFNELYLISGKKGSEWEAYFKMPIPPDASPGILRDMDVQLSGLFEEAGFMKTMSDIRLQAYKAASTSKYREAYAQLVAEYKTTGEGKRLPAKDTLQVLAEEKIGDDVDGAVHAEIELTFWKGILDKLNITRKIIENLTFNLNIEHRATQNQSFLDKMNNKKEQ